MISRAWVFIIIREYVVFWILWKFFFQFLWNFVRANTWYTFSMFMKNLQWSSQLNYITTLRQILFWSIPKGIFRLTNFFPSYNIASALYSPKSSSEVNTEHLIPKPSRLLLVFIWLYFSEQIILLTTPYWNPSLQLIFMRINCLALFFSYLFLFSWFHPLPHNP